MHQNKQRGANSHNFLYCLPITLRATQIVTFWQTIGMPHGNPKRGEQKVSKQVILTTYEGGNVGGPKFMFQWRFQKKKKKKKGKRKEKKKGKKKFTYQKARFVNFQFLHKQHLKSKH